MAFHILKRSAANSNRVGNDDCHPPMVSIELENVFGVGAHQRVTCQAVRNAVGFFATFFVNRVASYGNYLPDKMKINNSMNEHRQLKVSFQMPPRKSCLRAINEHHD